MLKVPIIIDGIRIEIERERPIIHAIKKAGIHVPTLCFHESLRPYGSCRLCMVEVVQSKQQKLVTSCSHPADSGMEVFTDTPKVREIRRMVMRLLLARSPDSQIIQNMARQFGVEQSRYEHRHKDDCILCGLCVRFCEEIVGVGALGLANRGIEREVATPFRRSSEVCIGCGSCSYICPTACIKMVSDPDTPSLHRMRIGSHSLDSCENNYQCEPCSTDQEFLSDFKRAVVEFRKDGRKNIL